MPDINRIGSILMEVEDELLSAMTAHPFPMHSPHEAHSVIAEEFDEFWDEVKSFNPRKKRDTRPRMREELIQLAAMAVRAIYEVIDLGGQYGQSINSEPEQVPSVSPQAAG